MSRLSKRLETIIELVPADDAGTVADIGTDHGFVPIRLVQDKKAGRAIAMDINRGPLERADAHIRTCDLEHVIETRRSNGLEKLNPGEADGVVIAGMGGDLMLRILKDGEHVRDSIRWWVLSPQSEFSDFRHGLEKLGLAIEEERMLQEDGKYYVVMLVRPGSMHYDKEYKYRYGDCLIRKKTTVLRDYLEKEKRQLEAILNQLSGQTGEAACCRAQAVKIELKELKEAYDAMQ